MANNVETTPSSVLSVRISLSCFARQCKLKRHEQRLDYLILLHLKSLESHSLSIAKEHISFFELKLHGNFILRHFIAFITYMSPRDLNQRAL